MAHSKLLAAALVSGLLAGNAMATEHAKKETKTTTTKVTKEHKKGSCSGPNGCGGKDGCAEKDSCKGKDGKDTCKGKNHCDGKDHCKGSCKGEAEEEKK